MGSDAGEGSQISVTLSEMSNWPAVPLGFVGDNECVLSSPSVWRPDKGTTRKAGGAGAGNWHAAAPWL